MNIEKNICRLCLAVAPDGMQNFTENSLILYNIHNTMRLHINTKEELFPKHICKDCIEKVDRTLKFYQKITDTENLLMMYFNEGIDSFKRNVLNLKGSNVIKKENEIKKELISSIEIEIKTEYEPENEDFYNEKTDADDDANESVRNNVATTENVSANEENQPENNTNKNDSSSKFKCLTCFELYDTQTLLLNHYNTEHFKPYKKGNIKNNFAVDTTEDGSLNFKCKDCTKEYRTKKSIVRHITLVHLMNARPFICKLCGRTYKTGSEIIRHARVHDGERFFCSKRCGYSTVYVGALKIHEARHDQSETKYKCEECGKGFHVKTWFEQHQNVHSGLKPFVCNICGLSFHMDRYLTVHRSSVHPQSSDLKRYICVHCSLPCDSKPALKKHLRKHGVGTGFLCDDCGKTCSSTELLKAHKIMHLRERPHICSTCNKGFSKKFNLQVHEKTHTGEKLHFCEKCEKSYTQRSTLVKHNMRHHPESIKK